MSTLGIDVSDHNTIVSWNRARVAGVRFAFVKTTQGIRFASPTATTQMHGATAAGITVGAYHFADSTGPVTSQVSNFLTHTPNLSMLALDVEPSFSTSMGSDLPAWSTAFLSSVHKVRPNATCFLYADVSDIASHDWAGTAQVAELWLSNPSGDPVPHSAFGKPAIVQGNKRVIDGIIGEVDSDQFYLVKETNVVAEKTYHVADYRIPDPKTKQPYTEKDLTLGDMVAQGYIMLTQLTEKLIRS